MVFINETDFFGVVINGLTTNITGDINWTLLMIVLLLFVFALTFSIPAEYVAPVLFPMFIVIAVFTSDLAFLLGVALFMIVLTVLRMWFI